MVEAALPFPQIDPVLIHLGPLAIRWYALSYIAGLLAGWWFVLRMLRDKSLWRPGKPPATADDIGDLVVWATIGTILGGRLGWVIFYGTFLCSVSPDAGFCHGLPMGFITDPIKIVAAWQGGMSFHGGLIGVLLAVLLFCLRRKLDPLRVGDLVASVAPIGLFFGRIANFINGELWGKPSNLPWAMIFPNPEAGGIPRHPSQLYEAGLEGLVLFTILQIGIRKFGWLKRPGLTVAVFFLSYGIFRAFVELFREPDAPFLGPISMGQMLSSLMWFVAAYFFWRALKPATKA